MTRQQIEILGMLASIVVLTSFTQSNIRKVRIINIVGAILYIAYGFLLRSPSIWFLNGALVCIHLYKLHKESK